MTHTRSLFTKNYILFSGVILLCFAMFFVFSFLLRSVVTSKERGVPPHHETFAALLRASDNPIETLKKYRTGPMHQNLLTMDLINKEGRSLVDGSEGLSRGLHADEIADMAAGNAVAFNGARFGPPEAFITEFEAGKSYLVAKFDARRMPPPPGMMEGQPGGGPRMQGHPDDGPPPGERGDDGPPPGEMRDDGPHPGGPMMGGPHRGPRPDAGFFGLLMGGGPGGPPRFLFFTSLLSFTLCMLISVGIALLIFANNYGRQAKAAMAVLDQMKHGDLKARMTSRKFDELAPLTQAYNQMADEVESLVESLKRSDLARRTMLQDLAHDLRTPLASLRVFLETLAKSGAKMTEEKKQEVLQISLSEISYFSELVEDLLFLAQISEPKYSRETDKVDMARVVADQATLFQNQYPNLKVTAELGPEASAVVPGSEQLLIRLVKNALANACSFARTSVVLKVEADAEKIAISVEDDGPGFSPGGLAEFGHKKASRKISKVGTGSRISVGIGSVIMREIATLHGGGIAAENQMREGLSAGARVQIFIKNL